VLLSFASTLAEVDAKMVQMLTPEVVAGIVQMIPDDFLDDDPMFTGPDARAQQREAYRAYLVNRLQSPRAFVEEAIRARSAHL
jgi:hypothetical protein